MDEKISQSEDYKRYASLLLERDSLEREAASCEIAYIARFGDLINEVFALKIDCIEKKKAIAFCQMQLNRGAAVDPHQLEQYLEGVMDFYRVQLRSRLEETENAKGAKQATRQQLHRAKKFYRHIAKLIHPDINPMTDEDLTLQSLWSRAVAAYKELDPEKLEEIQVLVTEALMRMGEQGRAILEKGAVSIFGIVMENIEEKIGNVEEQIANIRSTDPYRYKFLLDDPEAVDEKENSLTEEKAEYLEYRDELEMILRELKARGQTAFTVNALESLSEPRKGKSWRSKKTN